MKFKCLGKKVNGYDSSQRQGTLNSRGKRPRSNSPSRVTEDAPAVRKMGQRKLIMKRHQNQNLQTSDGQSIGFRVAQGSMIIHSGGPESSYIIIISTVIVMAASYCQDERKSVSSPPHARLPPSTSPDTPCLPARFCSCYMYPASISHSVLL